MKYLGNGKNIVRFNTNASFPKRVCQHISHFMYTNYYTTNIQSYYISAHNTHKWRVNLKLRF